MGMKIIASWIIGLSASFILLAWTVANQWTISAERRWMVELTADRQESWSLLWRLLSELASAKVMLVLLLAYTAYGYFTRRQVWEPAAVFCAVLGGLGCNSLLKLWFERPRPAVVQLVDASGFSFPSSNSVMAMSFYGMLAFVIASSHFGHGLDGKAARRIIYLLAGLVIASVGFARIYLGVHYPTDIVAGLLVGAVWLTACIGLYHRSRESSIFRALKS
jgi:membrane-associated phospholipid phosphatase